MIELVSTIQFCLCWILVSENYAGRFALFVQHFDCILCFAVHVIPSHGVQCCVLILSKWEFVLCLCAALSSTSKARRALNSVSLRFDPTLQRGIV